VDEMSKNKKHKNLLHKIGTFGIMFTITVASTYFVDCYTHRAASGEKISLEKPVMEG
jgi:hypothetical protein